MKKYSSCVSACFLHVKHLSLLLIFSLSTSKQAALLLSLTSGILFGLEGVNLVKCEPKPVAKLMVAFVCVVCISTAVSGGGHS